MNFLMSLEQIFLNKTHITLAALKWLFTCREWYIMEDFCISRLKNCITTNRSEKHTATDEDRRRVEMTDIIF